MLQTLFLIAIFYLLHGVKCFYCACEKEKSENVGMEEKRLGFFSTLTLDDAHLVLVHLCSLCWCVNQSEQGLYRFPITTLCYYICIKYRDYYIYN